MWQGIEWLADRGETLVRCGVRSPYSRPGTGVRLGLIHTA